jgi:hypothetical protein
MRFFRRRSNDVVVILLATAMQAALALSYAHVHAHGHIPGGTQAWAQAWAKSVATTMACRAVVPHAACPAPVSHDDSDCAACWSLTATGVGLLPVIASPPLKTEKLGTPEPLHAVAALSGGGTAHFQARAPPLA